MPDRSATHASFTLERVYDASADRVFAAWSTAEGKRAWFAERDGFVTRHYALDFRVGGREEWRGGAAGGPEMRYLGVHRDIVPGERIVIAYEVDVAGARLSVSLMTVELRPDGAGTRLTLTEQGVFLDGLDSLGPREQRTRELLDALEQSLAALADA